MSNFTLKVVLKDGSFMTNNRAETGGFDMLQNEAFIHIFPCGSCPEFYQDLLYGLAKLHGWEVSVEKQ